MKENLERPKSFAESMILVSVGLGLLYWLIDTILHAVLANEPLFLNSLLGIGNGLVWQRLIVIGFFVIFGSHVQYNAIKRHETEKRLYETEDRYRDLVEVSTDAIISTNEQMEVIQWNRAASDLFGYPKELIVGKSVDILIPYKFKEEHRAAFRRFLAADDPHMVGKTIEIEGLRKDGGVRPIELSLSAIKKDGEWTFISIIRETTERRKALEALRESEERYRNLFEDSKDAVMIWTSEYKILGVNQAALEIFGYEISEMIGSDISEVYFDPLDLSKFQMILNQEGSVRSYELTLKKKGDIKIDCLLTATVRRNRDGTILGYQGIIRDVTEQRYNENELKRTLTTLRKAMGGAIQAVAVMVETRDPYTAGHQRRVSSLSRTIGQEIGLSEEQVDGLRMAGMIHDLGKIAIPSDILSKPSKLTEHEYGIIRTHPQLGYDILKNIEFPWPIARMVLEHHEKIDGSGYPQGLKENDILIESRILTVADVVEAIASHRPYRPALGLEKALEEISTNKGVLYDSAVVDVCLRLFREKGFKFE